MEQIFLPIPDYPAYRISRKGEVQSRWLKAGRHSRLTDTWRPLTPIRRHSYLTVALSKDSKKTIRFVHRLVLEAYVGPCPPGLVACHNDGDPTNNRLDNLRWDSQKSNCADKLRHGTLCRGE